MMKFRENLNRYGGKPMSEPLPAPNDACPEPLDWILDDLGHEPPQSAEGTPSENAAK